MNPLVSIITPTYNHEKYIADCIKSVLCQTYENWEMIIVDDGSTDNTYSIALSYANSDSRIHVVNQKNVGIYRLNETYNFALAKSQGKYIGILEGDDVWLPEKLELQVAALEKDESIVLSWGQTYAAKEDLSDNYCIHPLKPLDKGIFNNTPVGKAVSQLIFVNFMHAPSILVRKTSLEKVGGFVQNHGLPLVDLPTWMQLSFLGTFNYIERPIAKWRMSPTQVTRNYSTEILEGAYSLSLEVFEQNKDLLKNMGVTLSQIRLYFHKKLIMYYSQSGRFKMLNKNFAGAKKDYLKSIFKFGLHEPIWKLRSVVGYLFALFNKDIEGFANKWGKLTNKSK